ncbi:hypothetical protein BCR37DRAFT_386704 [Protomyces lactucae-debilis]|uniref:NADP-dependent oxidoreductase domain-containing protein n=1 Tax=Protomyces lactucae-debilis TaxID=2754530 RepID=A0A1Y2FIA5_PROLT|nr:uncharacterized protein BCR37DRAFT_386704 [Protomyces lactucae-debilis]ORY83668.1 hypothetical protein BCR37DRAFT_386704 [Protomyces lactucae-debilis]
MRHQIELQPYIALPKLLDYCKENGTHLSAYSLLDSQDSDLLQDKTILSIAERRSTLSMPVVCSLHGPWSEALQISNAVAHPRSLQAQDVKLSEEDLKGLAKLDKTLRKSEL